MKSKPVTAPAVPRPVAAPAVEKTETLAEVAPPTTGWVAKAKDLYNRPLQAFDAVNDVKFDGMLLGANGAMFVSGTPLTQVPGVKPDNGEPVRGKAIFINGIMTDVGLNKANVQTLANTGLEVVAIHNATRGLMADIGQCIGDKMNLTHNKATDTAVAMLEQVLSEPAAGKLVFVGHSQGALVLSNALSIVAERMRDAGATEAEVEKKLSTVSIETLGGASWSFPRGPKFHHVVNRYDMIPLLSGKGMSSNAPDTDIVRFSMFGEMKDLPPLKQLQLLFARAMDKATHGLSEVYATAVQRGD